jgi:hypothetical protein
VLVVVLTSSSSGGRCGTGAGLVFANAERKNRFAASINLPPAPAVAARRAIRWDDARIRSSLMEDHRGLALLFACLLRILRKVDTIYVKWSHFV